MTLEDNLYYGIRDLKSAYNEYPVKALCDYHPIHKQFDDTIKQNIYESAYYKLAFEYFSRRDINDG